MNPRSERRKRPYTPRKRVEGTHDRPGYLTSPQVAELLGLPNGSFLAHRKESYAWLPAPERVGKVLWWHEGGVKAAIAAGRHMPGRGWHVVPDVTPSVSVWVRQKGNRPNQIRLDVLPDDDVEFVGDWLTDLETALADTYGLIAYIDSPSPCVPGTYTLRPMTAP